VKMLMSRLPKRAVRNHRSTCRAYRVFGRLDDQNSVPFFKS
jgi:hypothetical protein